MHILFFKKPLYQDFKKSKYWFIFWSLLRY